MNARDFSSGEDVLPDRYVNAFRRRGTELRVCELGLLGDEQRCFHRRRGRRRWRDTSLAVSVFSTKCRPPLFPTLRAKDNRRRRTKEKRRKQKERERGKRFTFRTPFSARPPWLPIKCSRNIYVCVFREPDRVDFSTSNNTFRSTREMTLTRKETQRWRTRNSRKVSVISDNCFNEISIIRKN